MSSVLDETLDGVIEMLEEIKSEHQQVKDRISSSKINRIRSEGAQKIQGLRTCITKIEEGKRRNSNTLKTILDSMKSLSEKVDALSIQVNSHTIETSKLTDICSTDDVLNPFSGPVKNAEDESNSNICKSNRLDVTDDATENVEIDGNVGNSLSTVQHDRTDNSIKPKCAAESEKFQAQLDQEKVALLKSFSTDRESHSLEHSQSVREDNEKSKPLDIQNKPEKTIVRQKTKDQTSKPTLGNGVDKGPPSAKTVKSSSRKSMKILLDTKQLPPIGKTAGGFKRRITKDDDDNRSAFYKQIECFQGDTLETSEQTEDTVVNDLPNIVNEPLQDRSTLGNPAAIGRSSKMMTMADIAVRDFEGTKQVKNLMEWQQVYLMNELKVQLEGLSDLLEGTRGHYYMLLLDTSESMQGERFSAMIKTTKTYLDGLQQVSSMTGIQDRVGLACYGEDTQLVLKPTTDYNKIRREIERFKPAGPSPLAAGLLMALSGVSRSGTTISEHSFQARIILLSDGLPTRVEAPNEEDRDRSKELAMSFLFGNRERDAEINKVVDAIASKGIRVYCVPIGSFTTDVLKNVAEKTCGKIIPPEEIHRLCRHTQVLYHASEIASQLQSSEEVNRDLISSSIVDAGGEVQTLNAYDDITDNVMILLDPMSQYPGKFKNPTNSAIALGTRVRRGPNWSWKNQDSNMAGTVIGQDNDGGMIWVEWDSGNKNCYHYDDRRNYYDIKPVNEPRRLVDEMIAVGCKVKRGRNWKYGNQDGGKGNRGTVLRVESTGKLVVYWEHGKLGVYMFENDGQSEVEVCEHGRTISSPDLISESETGDDDKDKPELPLILPTHTRKKKPVTFNWHFQDESGNWVAYDEETIAKLEHAYSRNSEGKCIIELEKTIFVVLFSKMVQENQADKTTTSVRRMAIIDK